MASKPIIPDTTQWIDDTQWVDDQFAPQAPSLEAKPSLGGDVGKLWESYGKPGAEFMVGGLMGLGESTAGFLKAIPGAAWKYAGLYQGDPRMWEEEMARQKESWRMAKETAGKVPGKSPTEMVIPAAETMDYLAGSIPGIGEELQATFAPIPKATEALFGPGHTPYERGEAAGQLGSYWAAPKLIGKAAGKIGRELAPEASYRKFRSNMDTALAHANDLGGGPTLPGGEIYHHRTMNAVAPYLKQWLDEKASGVKKFNTESLVQAADYMKKNFWDQWRSNVGAPLGGVNISTAAIKQAVIDRMPNVWRTVEGGNKIGQVQAALDSLLPEENITLQELMDKKSYLNHEMGMHQKRMFPEVKPNAASKADLLNTDPKAYVLDQLAEQMRQAADQTVTNQLNLPEGSHRDLMRDAEAIHDFSDKAYNLNQSWAPTRNLKGATPAAVKGAQVAATYELGIISPAKSAVHRTLNYIVPGMKNTPDNFVDFGLKHLRKASNVGPVREMLTQQGPPQLPPAEFPPMGGVTPGEQLGASFENVANEPGRTGPGNYPLLPPPPGEYPGVGVGEGTILGGTAAIPEQAIPGTTAVDVNPPNPVTTIRSNNQIVDQYMRPAKPREQVYPPWVEGEGEFVDPKRLPPPEGESLMAPPPGAEANLFSPQAMLERFGPELKGNQPRNKMGGQIDYLETPAGYHAAYHNPSTNITYISVPDAVMREASLARTPRGINWSGVYGTPDQILNGVSRLPALERVGEIMGNHHIKTTAAFIRRNLEAAKARGEQNIMVGSGGNIFNHELNHHLTRMLKGPGAISLFGSPTEATEFFHAATAPEHFKGTPTKAIEVLLKRDPTNVALSNELFRRQNLTDAMQEYYDTSPTYAGNPAAISSETPAFLSEGSHAKFNLSNEDAGKILLGLYDYATYHPGLNPAAREMWLLSHGPTSIDLLNRAAFTNEASPLKGTLWDVSDYIDKERESHYGPIPGEENILDLP